MDHPSPFAHIKETAGNKRLDRLSAYSVWFMVGMLGAHRFYCGRTWTGLLMLAFTMLSAVAALTVSMEAGQAAAIAVTLWWAVDGVLILRWIPTAIEEGPSRPGR